MGFEKLPERFNGKGMDETWFNRIKQVLIDVIAPRNSEGVVEDEAGNLGSATYRFKRAYVTSGSHFTGEIKWKYDFNGTVPADPGWMLCDGRTVTEANYNTEHGSGKWASEVVTSPIASKTLPNINARYFTGASATQSGAGTITPVGNTGHLVNLAHDHGTVTTSGPTPAPTLKSTNDVASPVATESHTHQITTTSSLGSESFQPLSVAYRAYMRIV